MLLLNLCGTVSLRSRADCWLCHVVLLVHAFASWPPHFSSRVLYSRVPVTDLVVLTDIQPPNQCGAFATS